MRRGTNNSIPDLNQHNTRTLALDAKSMKSNQPLRLPSHLLPPRPFYHLFSPPSHASVRTTQQHAPLP